MTNAPRDNNFVPVRIMTLNTDGKTIVVLRANPTNHAMKVSNGSTGSDRGPKNALRDENDVPVMMGVSSTDLVTPVVIYGTSIGELLIQTT